MGNTRLIVAGIAAAAVSLVAVVAAPTVGAGSVGPAPDFRLPLLGRNGTIGLSDLKGRPAVLLFWAPW